MLICRGGGSLEDLWPFNEEIVARAIAACTIPTISGVGHETDFTICDLVADLRAPTPSAAAEIVIRAKSEICMQIDNGVRRIRQIVENRVRNYRHELRHLASSDGLGLLPRRIAARRERLERARVRMHHQLESRARTLRLAAGFEGRIAAAMSTRLTRARHNLERDAARLDAVSPLSVLSRGYAIAFKRAGKRRKPILDSAAVGVGEQIEVQLKRGRLAATVDSKTMGVESVWPSVKDDGTL